MTIPSPAVLAALAAVLLCPGVSAQSPARRASYVVESRTQPCVRVYVDAELVYLGRVEGPVMQGQARAERFVFGDIEGGRLERAAIVHFESFVDTSGGRFSYPRFRMDTLGGQEYLHQVWPVPDLDLFTTVPIDSLLRSRGVSAGPDWLLNRWARVVSDDARHEILLFYLESGSRLGANISALRAEWQPQGIANAPHRRLEADLIGRARRTIRVEAPPSRSTGPSGQTTAPEHWCEP